MQTLGIDLSTDPRKVWACEIDWAQSPPRITGLDRMSDQVDPLAGQVPETTRRPAVVRSEGSLIAELVARITAFAPSPERVVGVDIPLGWPAAFVEAVGDWDDGDLQGFRKRPDLRLRATDRFVQLVTRVTPMSVSTDRMGSTAMLLAEALSRTARRLDHPAFDRARGRDGIAEVHPAAALRLWTLEGEPLCTGTYKGWYPPRQSMVLRVARAGFEFTPAQAQTLIDSDDALDAFLCALLARAVAVGACLGVDQPVDLDQLAPKANRGANPDTVEQLAERLDLGRAIQAEATRTATTEGWIHLPQRGDLADALGLTPGSASWLPEALFPEETDVPHHHHDDPWDDFDDEGRWDDRLAEGPWNEYSSEPDDLLSREFGPRGWREASPKAIQRLAGGGTDASRGSRGAGGEVTSTESP